MARGAREVVAWVCGGGRLRACLPCVGVFGGGEGFVVVRGCERGAAWPRCALLKIGGCVRGSPPPPRPFPHAPRPLPSPPPPPLPPPPLQVLELDYGEGSPLPPLVPEAVSPLTALRVLRLHCAPAQHDDAPAPAGAAGGSDGGAQASTSSDSHWLPAVVRAARALPSFRTLALHSPIMHQGFSSPDGTATSATSAGGPAEGRAAAAGGGSNSSAEPAGGTGASNASGGGAKADSVAVVAPLQHAAAVTGSERRGLERELSFGAIANASAGDPSAPDRDAAAAPGTSSSGGAPPALPSLQQQAVLELLPFVRAPTWLDVPCLVIADVDSADDHARLLRLLRFSEVGAVEELVLERLGRLTAPELLRLVPRFRGLRELRVRGCGIPELGFMQKLSAAARHPNLLVEWQQ